MINGVIYKYTSPCGKVYIGQTIQESERRATFLNEENPKYAGNKINQARKKYGPQNFEYEVIFKVSSLVREEVIEILNQKEIQYIKVYDSFYNGYNSTTGGGANYQFSEETRQKLSQTTTEYYQTHDSAVARPVLQYTAEGILVKEWKSAREAELATGIDAKSIAQVCIGKRSITHNFIWKYKDDYSEIPQKIKIKKARGAKLPLVEYTLDGVETRRWDSVAKAALELGYSQGNFSTYCNGRNNHEYKGFLYYRGGKDLQSEDSSIYEDNYGAT